MLLEHDAATSIVFERMPFEKLEYQYEVAHLAAMSSECLAMCHQSLFALVYLHGTWAKHSRLHIGISDQKTYSSSNMIAANTAVSTYNHQNLTHQNLTHPSPAV